MDFQRNRTSAGRWIAPAIIGVLVLIATIGARWGLSRLLPGVPTVDCRETIIGTVQRGEFIHEVRCVGQLVSTEQIERPARTDARVQRIVELPGVRVSPDTLLVELANQDLERSVIDAKSKLSEAEATLVTEEARFDRDVLQLESAWCKLKSEHAVAQAEYEVKAPLGEKRHYPELDIKKLKITAEGLKNQRDLAKASYDRFVNSRDNYLAVYRERIAQATTNAKHAQSILAALNVYAGVEGVLAQVPVTAGQQLAAGEMVAKIVDPKRLKAELRVAEVEARYIRAGQNAKIDTRHGVIVGTVSRVEPEVRDGSVTIDVVFAMGKLPSEARPDLSVTGLVEVNRVEDVLYVARPASAMSEGRGNLFACEKNEKANSQRAVLKEVEYGIASANQIVIRTGLAEGDRIIVQDLPRVGEATEVLLENYAPEPGT